LAAPVRWGGLFVCGARITAGSRLYLRLDVRQREVIGREHRLQLVELPVNADAFTP
jgi:hypothetical protein